ncbi:hypothetical protein C8D77_11052 [Mesorhizobium loti]|jgi:hypothetical protein|uniref:Uncharacterized protein n=1 Tax=Rhizobium loti TaxID=381 RepID=A0A8E2W8V9_RHILI|nr:hypothetical protein C8D77_11052 [Mesorhizobium loti]
MLTDAALKALKPKEKIYTRDRRRARRQQPEKDGDRRRSDRFNGLRRAASGI